MLANHQISIKQPILFQPLSLLFKSNHIPTYLLNGCNGNWWQQWYAWRSSGIFDNVPAPETSSSSTAPYVPDAKSNNDEKDDKGSKEETPKTNEKSKKQNKKKKGKRW